MTLRVAAAGASWLVAQFPAPLKAKACGSPHPEDPGAPGKPVPPTTRSFPPAGGVVGRCVVCPSLRARIES
ncbi:hypothetical protein GCM10010094_39640 [Streptomyces flaveus]|uniref:Uncharacterized protein n=1 Tax=Streptomyces flaveus TaxID=66370 RepID=A0A917QWX8_9ACTN|nr:hypothetical protein GCM10010094_39640 [Streptomyces flaveus]